MFYTRKYQGPSEEVLACVRNETEGFGFFSDVIFLWLVMWVVRCVRGLYSRQGLR